jgi:hypothetical protein
MLLAEVMLSMRLLVGRSPTFLLWWSWRKAGLRERGQRCYAAGEVALEA